MASEPDGRIRLWYLTTGKELRVFQRRGSFPHQVFGSQDGDTLIATTFRQVIYAWSVASGTEHSRVQCQMRVGFRRAVSADGRILTEEDRDHISVWELATGQERLRLTGKPAEWSGALAFSPDGKWLVGAFPRSLAVWDLASGQKVGQVAGLTCSASVLAFSPDGKVLASGNIDGTILL